MSRVLRDEHYKRMPRATVGVARAKEPALLNAGTVINAEHRSNSAALHRQWRRLYMSEKFSTKNHKQANKFLYNSIF